MLQTSSELSACLQFSTSGRVTAATDEAVGPQRPDGWQGSDLWHRHR